MFERYGTMGPTFAVSWVCPQCDARLLDVCSPLLVEIQAGQCLNCGELPVPHESCSCGVGRAALVAQVHERFGDPPALDRIDELFARGYARSAFNALDLRLETHANAETWLAKAKLSVDVGLLEPSTVFFERALATGATIVHRLSLAKVLARLERHGEAAELYAGYLDDAPSGPHRGLAHIGLSRSLHATGQLERAEAQLRLALDETPDDIQARTDLHTLLSALGRPREALAELERAIAGLNESNARQLWPARAELLCELERGEEAVELTTVLLEGTPDDPRLRYTHGRALALCGRLEQAEHAMSSVLELEPDNAAARRALDMIRGALAR